jgi:hypothetical protein
MTFPIHSSANTGGELLVDGQLANARQVGETSHIYFNILEVYTVDLRIMDVSWTFSVYSGIQ